MFIRSSVEIDDWFVLEECGNEDIVWEFQDGEEMEE